jgi:hypothetical protein
MCLLVVGQWAPVVGTGLAALGSLYLFLSKSIDIVEKDANPNRSEDHCNCSHHHHSGERNPSLQVQRTEDGSPSSRDTGSIDSDVIESPLRDQRILHEVVSNELLPTTSVRTLDGNRRKVAETLTAIGNHFSNAAHSSFDDSEFKHGIALDFPEIPGEIHRNRALPQIREQYNQPRDADGNVTPGFRGHHSRTNSFTGSVRSGFGVEDSSSTPKPTLSQSPQSPHSPSLTPSHASTFPIKPASLELNRQRSRRDTLEVPSPVYHGPTRSKSSASSVNSTVT